MLDTWVYIDILQGTAPQVVEDILKVRIANHSSVRLAELTHLFGRLDSKHPKVSSTLRELRSIIAQDIPVHRPVCFGKREYSQGSRCDLVGAPKIRRSSMTQFSTCTLKSEVASS